MALARSSFPDPLGPWISTVLLLSATAGRSARIFCTFSFLLTMSPLLNLPDNSLRRASMADRSRKVSAPPIIFPFSSRRTAVLMLIGRVSPLEFKISTGRSMISRPVSTVFFKAQAVWQMLA